MSKFASTSALPSTKKKQFLPIVFVIDESVPPLVQGYCAAVLSTLQSLHSSSQLIVSSISPSSHPIPTPPFLSPSAFLATLPSSLQHSSRIATTLWRSQSGLLRAIRTGTRLLQLEMDGSEGRKAMLPRYLVVISHNDLALPQDEVYFEEDDGGDGSEEWETVSTLFGKVPHQTTLLSLIALGHTPNLDQFWKASTSHLPAHLIANSTLPAPTSPPFFPLLSPSHAYFLAGFSNTRANAAVAPDPLAAAASAVPLSTKRAPPGEPTIIPSKKLRPNAPTMAAGSLPPSTLSTPVAAPIPIDPSLLLQPTLVNPPRTRSPALQPQVNTEQQIMDGYLETLSGLNAGGANGFPQGVNTGATNFADIQAALAAYPTAAPPRPPPIPQQQQQLLQQQQQIQMQQQQQQQLPPQARTLTAASLTPAQINALPQLPPDMMSKITELLQACRDRFAKGEVTKEQSELEISQLKNTMNTFRLKAAQDQYYSRQQAAAQAQQQQGLGVAPQQRGRPSPQPAYANLPNPNLPGPHPNQPYRPPSQPQINPALRQGPPPQQQQAPPNIPRPPPNPIIWQGSISWSSGDKGNKREITMWCSASAIQATAVAELATVIFPPQLRISSLVPVSMEALQKLATEHQLPAVNLAPIPSGQLSDAIRNDLLSVGSNEDLYSMFAKSMDQRKTCGIVKFGPTPSTGMVILSIPSQARFVGIVFQRTPLPESWLHPAPALALQQQQQQQQQQQNLQQPNLFALQQAQQQQFLAQSQLQTQMNPQLLQQRQNLQQNYGMPPGV